MIKYSHLTDTGRNRDHNEDYYDFDENLGLYIICDGMGGHAAGEVASELACKTIVECLKSHINMIQSFVRSDDLSKRKRISDAITEAIDRANDKVYKVALQDESKRGMGTTVVLFLATPAGIFAGHVGDSRGYLIRHSQVMQMTEDHSLVNDLVRSGTLSKEEAVKHPQANVITQAVGVHEVVQPDVTFYEVMKGDLFVLSSDGLHDYLNDTKMLDIIDSTSVKQMAHEFVKFANREGGKDNITCVCLQWGDPGLPPEHPSHVTIAKKVDVLKKISLFSALNYKEISQLLEIIQVRNIDEDTRILNQGEAGEDMFILLKGDVEVRYDDEVVAELGPGKYFGEMSLIDKSPRSASVITKTKCKCMRLVRSELFPLLKKEPRIGLKIFWAFLQNMNRRLRENDRKVFELHQDYIHTIDSIESTSSWNLSTLDKS